MPRGDRTGPRGMGPMTGGARGYCAGHPWPGYPGPGYMQAGGRPRGYGGAWGAGGWGRRNWYYATGQPGWMRFGGAPGYAPPAPVSPEQAAETESQFLQQQADWLKDQLESIQARLDDLSAPDTE